MKEDDHPAKSSTPSKQKRELKTHKTNVQLSKELETEAYLVKKLRQRAEKAPRRLQ